MRSLFICILAGFFSSAWAENEIAACQHLRLMLDWRPNPDHAPLVIAQQEGFFADRGLCVKLIEPKSTHDNVESLVAKTADVSLSYQIQTQIEVANGQPLQVVGTLIPTPLNVVMSLGDGGVKKLADLKGRKVGFSDSGATQKDILKTMLTSVGVSYQDIEMVDIEFDMKGALIDHKVDAVINAYRNYEPFQMELAGYSTTLFKVEDYGVPTFSQLIFVVNSNNYQRDSVDKFLSAIQQALKFLKDSPEKSWRSFATYKSRLKSELNYMAWNNTVETFTADPHFIDRQAYAVMAKFLLKRGFISKPLDTDSMLPASKSAVAAGAPLLTAVSWYCYRDSPLLLGLLPL